MREKVLASDSQKSSTKKQEPYKNPEKAVVRYVIQLLE